MIRDAESLEWELLLYFALMTEMLQCFFYGARMF